MGITEILTLLSLLASGGGAIASAVGRSKETQTADEKQKAMNKYLEANLPTFNYQSTPFDQTKYADVLDPLQERQRNTMQKMGTSMALQGLGRSGIGNRIQANALRKGQQDYSNVLTGLARQDEAMNYDRAYKKYLADAERVRALASSMA